MATDNKGQFTHYAAPVVRAEDTLSQEVLDAATKAGYGVSFIYAEAQYAARVNQTCPKPENK
jgi:hypothetical protein